MKSDLKTDKKKKMVRKSPMILSIFVELHGSSDSFKVCTKLGLTLHDNEFVCLQIILEKKSLKLKDKKRENRRRMSQREVFTRIVIRSSTKISFSTSRCKKPFQFRNHKRHFSSIPLRGCTQPSNFCLISLAQNMWNLYLDIKKIVKTTRRKLLEVSEKKNSGPILDIV